MALTVTNPARSYSIGPVKQALFTYTAASGDTSGTFTVPFFHIIDAVMTDGGLQLTSAASISGAAITLAFTAVPTGGIAGTLLVHGK